MATYEQEKFQNLIRIYREGIGQLEEQEATVKRLHERVEKLENENADLRKANKATNARINDAGKEFKKLKEAKP